MLLLESKLLKKLLLENVQNVATYCIEILYDYILPKFDISLVLPISEVWYKILKKYRVMETRCVR